METKDLAKNLKDLRALRGMSQEYLAEEARVSLRTVQRIEKNESKPTGETLKRIATALGVELNDLIGLEGTAETSDLKATIVFLKKKLSQAEKKSEITTFERFIEVLENLEDKELSSKQRDKIEAYLAYLKLDEIPDFNNDMFKQKLKKFKSFLSQKMRFVPRNYFLFLAVIFAGPFVIGFTIQPKVDFNIKLGVITAVVLVMFLGNLLDRKIKRENRDLRF